MNAEDKLKYLTEGAEHAYAKAVEEVAKLAMANEPDLAYFQTWKMPSAVVAQHQLALMRQTAKALEHGKTPEEAIDYLRQRCISILTQARVDGSSGPGSRLV